MFRLHSALLLGAFVSGCGFRSGLETEDFELVSFALDQSSYVQGETGVATATIRNLGPRSSAPPDVALRGSGIAGSLQVSEPQSPATVEPGATGIVTWTFVSAEDAEPGSGDAWVKVVDDGGTTESPPVPITLLRAATLDVTGLAFVAPPNFGAIGEAVEFACAGGRSAFVLATLHNSGGSAANVSDEVLLVSGPGGSLDEHVTLIRADANPGSVPADGTATFLFSLKVDGGTPARTDYLIVFSADVTDATTGHVRPEPSQPESLDLPLTVHRPPGFAITILENATNLSTSAPEAGAITINIVNTGTVTVELTDVFLQMFLGTETTSEYQLGLPTAALPVDIAPGSEVAVAFLGVSLASLTPTLGATAVHALATGDDPACFTQPAGNSEENGSEGAWTVVP